MEALASEQKGGFFCKEWSLLVTMYFVVYLVHVKNEVQLADTFEALVKCFDENLNEVKDAQFGFRTVDTEDEVEGRIMPVYQFVVRPTDETKSNTNTLIL